MITRIDISGPPGGYKSMLATRLRDIIEKHIGEEVYINEENGAIELGDKDKAKFHIYMKQTSE